MARATASRIVYSDERPQALETAGGIFRALPQLAPGPFAVVNGDVFTDLPFASLRIAANRDAHLVLVPNPPQHPQGDFGLEHGLALAVAPRAATHSPASPCIEPRSSTAAPTACFP